MLLSEHIVNIEKLDGICLLTEVAHEFSGSSDSTITLQKSLFLHTFLSNSSLFFVLKE